MPDAPETTPLAAPSGATARLALPYPIPDDPVDVPRDVQALATKLDPSVAVDSQGTFAARPAAGVAGRYYYATDQNTLWRDTGSTWVALGGAAMPLPIVTTLPVSAVDGQQVVWNPDYAAMGSLNAAYWHMVYRTSDSRWHYVGGPPARTAAFGAITDIPASSTIGKADPQVKWTNGQGLTLPAAGDWLFDFITTVRASGSNPAAAGTVGLCYCRNWNTTINNAVRFNAAIMGPNDGFVFTMKYVISSPIGDVIGLGLQGTALSAGQGWVWNENGNSRLYMTPDSIAP
jgi:hypothetical protein